MTHLPLTLGEYTTAGEGPATITHIGKHGKWAFNAWGNAWLVKTGVHRHEPALNITGRVEPAVGQTITVKWSPEPLISADDEKAAPKAPRECWMDDGDCTWSDRSTAARYCKRGGRPIRMIEAAPIEAELARVTAERDEAVALLRRWNALNIGGTKTTPETRAFLAKIGGKP